MTELYAGSGYGQVLTINCQLPKNKQKINKIGMIKKQRIIAINMLANTTNQQFLYCSEKNIYLGSLNQQIQTQIYSYKYSSQKKLIGLTNAKNDSIFHAFNDGTINYLTRDQNDEFTMKQILKGKIEVNEKKHYKKFIYDGNSKHCLIGKQMLPFIYDGQKQLITWNGKNVPNDELDLRVEVNDVDGAFFKNSSSLACAHSNNKVRIYDVRSNKQKPSADYALKFDKVYNKSYLTRIVVENQGDNLFYIANDLGAVYQCDIRRSMQVIGKFKGINTTVTDMQILEDQLFVSSLDCYVRSFDLESKEIVDKYYMNKPIYCINVNKNDSKQLQDYEQIELSEQEQVPKQTEQSKKMKKLRKRNKVNLRYLKQVNWDEVPIDPQLLKQAKEEYEQINCKDADEYLDNDEEYEVKIKNQHNSDEDSDLD